MEKSKTKFSREYISLFIIAFLFAFKTVYDSDVWWHLAAGKWLWQSGESIAVDPFSFTYRGAHWVDITWAYDLVLYLLYSARGSYLPIEVLFACIAGVCAILSWKLFSLLRPNANAVEKTLALTLFVFSFSLAELRWNHRPEQLSQLYGILFLFLLCRKKHLWILPLIQVAWVNTHGLFLLGPALWGLFWLSDLAWNRSLRRNPYSLVGLGIGLACLVNPLGWGALGFAFHLWFVLNHPFYQTTIPEAGNPFREPLLQNDAWYLLVYTALLALTLLLLLLRRKQGALKNLLTSTHLAFLLLSAVLFYLCVLGRRNIALYVMWSVPWFSAILGEALSPFLQRKAKPIEAFQKALPVAAIGIPTIIAILLVTNCFPRAQGTRFHSEANRIPSHLADWVKSFPRPLRFFAGTEVSNFLMWSVEGYAPYIDSRFAELYPLEHFRRYMDVLAHPMLVHEEVAKYGIEAVGMHFSNSMERALVQQLAQDSQWKTAFIDEDWVIFLKSSTLSEFEKKGWKNSPLKEIFPMAEHWVKERKQREQPFNLRRNEDLAIALTKLSAVSLGLGNEEKAAHFLRQATDLGPSLSSVQQMRCSIAFFRLNVAMEQGGRSGERLTDLLQTHRATMEETKQICYQAYRKTRDPSLLMPIALIHFNGSHYLLAEYQLAKITRLLPLHYEAQLFLARTRARLSFPAQEVERQYLQAGRLRPYEDTPRRELTEWLRQAGNGTRADALEQARPAAPN